jgi:putative ubiquitin-RnfH superfamily antitoxin RatB of RatAB toxin-antitoxin module
MIDVEVVYCPQPGVVDRVELSLRDGCTLRGALDASGLLARHGLSSESVTVGVWGRQQGLDAKLRSRDRVEIYRPLQCDPKEARRLRYRAKAPAGKGTKA